MAHEFHVENAFSLRGALHDTTCAPSLTGCAHVALAPGVRTGNMGRSLPCQMRIFDNVCVLTKRISNEGAKPSPHYTEVDGQRLVTGERCGRFARRPFKTSLTIDWCWLWNGPL